MKHPVTVGSGGGLQGVPTWFQVVCWRLKHCVPLPVAQAVSFLSPLKVTATKTDRCIPFLSLQAAAINRYYCKPHPLLCALGSGTNPHEKSHKKKSYGLSAAPGTGAAALQLTSWTTGLN